MTLVELMRNWCSIVRTRPTPLSAAIPMVQKAADALEKADRAEARVQGLLIELDSIMRLAESSFDSRVHTLLIREAIRTYLSAPEKKEEPHPEVGFLLDGATKGELAAYDQGSGEALAAVLGVLNGQDDGSGVANEPWEGVRRRLLNLVSVAAEVPEGCTPADARVLRESNHSLVETVSQLEGRLKALDSLCTQVLNSRVGVENELAEMVAGKRPMPDKEKLRELAYRLGDPSFRARYDDLHKGDSDESVPGPEPTSK